MSIHRLTALVPPPAQPSEVGSPERWQQTEQQLGTPLPSDYRDFVFTYGSGLFARFYRVYNPFAASEYTALVPSVERTLFAIREKKAKWPEEVPYRLHPERPGLLPWGNDENGSEYYWLTEGPPHSWFVVSENVRGEGFREYGRCMTDFLAEVLLGKIRALAGDYPQDDDRVFEAWTK